MSPPFAALKTFGYACYPYLRPYNKHKLKPRSVECVFLGYPPLSKGYLCLDTTTNTIYTVYYALFKEDVLPFSHKSDLIISHVPFSTPVLNSNWFPNSSIPTSIFIYSYFIYSYFIFIFAFFT